MGLKDKTSGKRMMEIQSILRKHKAFSELTPEKATLILEDLGPTFVKIGQIASNRSDLLPKEYCDAFAKLRTDAPPISFEVVIDRIEESFGRKWQEVFSSIEGEPLGSASIAQVHKAVMHDGSEVAIKVRRPGIEEQMAEDITLMKHVLALAEFSNVDPGGIMPTLNDLIIEVERATADELDFSVELGNLVRFREEMEAQHGVTSPIPYPEYTSQSVLAMEFVTGTLVNDVDKLKEAGVDPDDMGERIAQSYVTQIIDNGFFHADPHPGNIVIRKNEIVWIDLGMTGTLTANERSLIGKVFRAVATNDPFALKGALLSLAKAKGPIDHGLLVEQMSNMLNTYSTVDLADINIGLAFTDIIEVLRTQNLSLPGSFTMLARGLLTIEGVVAELSPTISIVSIVSDHVEKQMRSLENIEGKAKELLSSSLSSAEAMTHIPSQVSHVLEMAERGQVKVQSDLKIPEEALSALQSATGLFALALISAGLFVGSSVLCTTSMEPRVLGVPVLGFLGYVGAFILGMYVIWRTLYGRHKQNNRKKR